VVGLLGGAYLLSRTEPPPPQLLHGPAPELTTRAGNALLQAPAGTLSAVRGEHGEPDEAGLRLRRAEEILANYRRFAQYPPGSRPAKEHPDQMTPLAPVVRQQPLYGKGQANEEVRVQLGQDRRELVGDESVRLWLRCEDSQGKVLPCQVPQATAMVAPPQESNVPSVAVRFADDGRSGDAQSDDGTLTATVQPVSLGFGQLHGPLRVQLSISMGREQGSAFFDVMYTPDAPARFAGKVSESVSGGSLVLSVGLHVTRPGRYFVIGRVDDHREQQLAYLEWDGQLVAGAQTVPLTVFGKLMHDQRPELPLRLRDVEGFLFVEDSAPDRMHLPRLAGVVHTTQVYSLADFSDREWDSEQKRRYLDEYQKDVEQAAREATQPASKAP